MAIGLDDALIGMAVAQGVGGLLGSDAASTAGAQQTAAANRATDTNLQMFNTVNSQAAPYRQGGYSALNELLRGLGLPGTSSASTGAFGGSPSAAFGGMSQAGGNSISGAGHWEQKQVPGDDNADIKYAQTWVPGADPKASAALPGGAVNYNGQAFDSLDSLKNALVSDYVRQGGDPSSQQYQASLQDVLSKATPSAAGGQQQQGPGTFDNGYFAHQFGANDLNANLAPNYAFTLAQGQGAAKNALNLTGGLGGNFGKGLVDYTTGKAGDAYQNAFSNYTTNQNNIFNRLATIAGYGQGANQTTANAGTTLSGNIGNAQMAAGASQAAGTIGSTNALTGGASNAASWFALPSILKMGSTGATDVGGV